MTRSPRLRAAYLPGGEHESDSTTLRSALVHSSNRAAVHLLQRVGLRPTIDLADRMGLDSMPAVPSLALGTGEVSLLNLTSAYTVFANGGILQPPTFIRRVEDADGRVHLSRRGGRPPRAERNHRVSDGLDAGRRGGPRHRLQRPHRPGSACRPAARPARPTITTTRGLSASRRISRPACGWGSTARNRSCAAALPAWWRCRPGPAS